MTAPHTRAHAEAAAIAERAQVTVRELTSSELAPATQLLESIWGTPPVTCWWAPAWRISRSHWGKSCTHTSQEWALNT